MGIIEQCRFHRYHLLLVAFVLTVSLLAVVSCTGATPTPTRAPEEVSIPVVLQEGNDLPKVKLQHRDSKELEDNRIGTQMDLVGDIVTQEGWTGFVRDFTAVGYKRIRLITDHGDYPMVDWSKRGDSKFVPDPYHDKIVKAFNDNGVKIILSLMFWDRVSHEKEMKIEGYTRFRTQDEVERYLDYVRSAVRHFKGQIDYYEIWNEPNLEPGTQQSIEVLDYINMVKQVVPVIRQEDPQAKVMVGAVTELNRPDFREYFFTILSSDLMPIVNGISFHPMYGTSPKYEHLKEYYYYYPSLAQQIKDTASAHGLNGEYLADEMCWFTLNDDIDPNSPWIYSDLESAKYYARSIVMHLGMGFVATPGATHADQPDLPKSKVIQNLCTVMSGTEPTYLAVDIDSEATNIVSYSFGLSNGDRLFALWTDGVAVDDDPGVAATLTLHGVSAKEVLAIDVLNGFEQQLIISTESGNLVINNLLIKDYPIILRITS